MATFSQIKVGQKFETVGSGFGDGRIYQKTGAQTYFQIAPRDLFCGRTIKPRVDIEVKPV